MQSYNPPEALLREMQRECTWESCVLKLMTAIFTQEELQTSTPMGTDSRAALDAKKMKFIEGWCSFPICTMFFMLLILFGTVCMLPNLTI